MYENSGRRLKRIVLYATTLLDVASGLLGLAVYVIAAETFDDGLGIMLGCLTAGMGWLFAWLSGLVISTFADIEIYVEKMSSAYSSKNVLESAMEFNNGNAAKPANQPTPGGWTCTCGRNNAKYVATCPCGINRRELGN